MFKKLQLRRGAEKRTNVLSVLFFVGLIFVNSLELEGGVTVFYLKTTVCLALAAPPSSCCDTSADAALGHSEGLSVGLGSLEGRGVVLHQ